MTDRALIERLRGLLAKASVTPLAYRPNELDDWGTIRGGGVPFEPDALHFIASVRDSRVDHDTYPQHRAAKTDPYEDVTRLIVEGINALPALLDALESLSPPPVEGVERLREALHKIEAGATHSRLLFEAKMRGKRSLTWNAVNELQDYLEAAQGTAREALSLLGCGE